MPSRVDLKNFCAPFFQSKKRATAAPRGFCLIVLAVLGAATTVLSQESHYANAIFVDVKTVLLFTGGTTVQV